MARSLRSFLPLLVIAALAVTFVAYRPHAQEVAPEEEPPVSDAELTTYINVYKAMQSDHGLTIDDAIKPYNISLDAFRHTERRVQDEPRLVERVREALLEHARTSSTFAFAMHSPTPGPTATPAKSKKKR